MEISVIIPTYKPQDYFWECLESLECQTLSKNQFKVIIVLNGCCEPYKTLIDNWIIQHNLHVNFIQTNQGGVSNARNIGMTVANSQYITFLDDDDFVSPCYLEALLEKAAPDTVVLSDSRSFIDGSTDYSDDYSLHKIYQKSMLSDRQNLFHVRSMFNGPCMKLFPSSLIQDFRFDPDLKNGEDSIFMFAVSYRIKRISYTTTESIYYRRIRKGSATTNNLSYSYLLKNSVKLMWRYSSHWIKRPFSYNVAFALSRYVATIKTIIIGIRN